jgi:LCP family protein required for cell wall assembly
MAAKDDPFEQYFRPRPAGAEGPGGPVAEDSGTWDAVSIEPSKPRRVEVRTPRRESAHHARTARRKRRSLSITAAASSFVLLSSGAAWAFQDYLNDRIKTVDITVGGNHTGPKGAMNILLAGVDRRDGMSPSDIRKLHLGREQGARSDTMMLMHVSKDHDKVTIVSLPRDTLVTIPAHGKTAAQKGKLTWAYSYGGAQLMKDTVQGLTGITIDHYIEVNFLGFLKVVDAVGGVDICTNIAINDKDSGLKLTPGTHHVDGATALAYARARHGLGEDIGRMQRQQEFMSALMNQAVGKIKDPLTGAKFLTAVLGAVRVDAGLKKDMTELADQFKDLSLGNVEFAKVPIADQNHSDVIGGTRQSTVLLDKAAATDMFRKISNDESLVAPKPAATATAAANPLTVAPSSITVRVRNGVGTTGIAKNASDELTKVGFRASWVTGVFARADTKPTLIRYGPSRADSARTLAAALPGAKLKKVAALGSQIEIIVGSVFPKPKRVTVAGQAATPDKIETKTATENLCKK